MSENVSALPGSVLLESMRGGVEHLQTMEETLGWMKGGLERLYALHPDVDEAHDFTETFKNGSQRDWDDLLNWVEQRIVQRKRRPGRLAQLGYLGRIAGAQEALVEREREAWRMQSVVQQWIGRAVTIEKASPYHMIDTGVGGHFFELPDAELHRQHGTGVANHRVGIGLYVVGEIADLSLEDSGSIELRNGQVHYYSDLPTTNFDTATIAKVITNRPPLEKRMGPVPAITLDVRTKVEDVSDSR